MFNFQLKDNEKVVAMYRQTEIILVKPLIIVFLAVYLPWYLLLRYDMAYQFRWEILAWTFLVLLYAVYQYLVWVLNVNLITTSRVVCVRHNGLFKKNVAESPLELISSIGFTKTGVWSTLFRYGDVNVHIMNVVEPLVFYRVRRPAEVKDFLWRICSKIKHITAS